MHKTCLREKTVEDGQLVVPWNLNGALAAITDNP